MVGGKIVQIYQDGPNRMWVNVFDEGDYCAIFCDEAPVKLGDSLWWQAQWAYWTPKDGSVADVKIKRQGYSGVTHPLGKEYQIKQDFEESFRKARNQIRELKSQLQ